MFPSAGYGIQCLSAALDLDCGITLCACLDGCHIGHTSQNPEIRRILVRPWRNWGNWQQRKVCPALYCQTRIVRAHGGMFPGTMDLAPLARMYDQTSPYQEQRRHSPSYRNNTGMLSENAGSIQCSSSGLTDNSPQSISVVILITHSPYTTEHTYGGIALAAACAHQGIPTRVVFLEEGILALTREAPGSCRFRDVFNTGVDYASLQKRKPSFLSPQYHLLHAGDFKARDTCVYQGY